MKFSFLICAFLFVGCTNAQNFCDLAKTMVPAAISCTGTGAAVTLTASIDVPVSLTTTSKLSIAFVQDPCTPASARVDFTDSAGKIFDYSPPSIKIASGTNSFPVAGASISVPTVGDIGLRLDVTLSGGINDAAGLNFKVGLSVCVDEKCNKDLSSTLDKLVGGLPFPIFEIKVPKSTFTDAQLATLCPPKASSSEKMQLSWILATAAAGVVAMVM
jgi:hypothetical protein